MSEVVCSLCDVCFNFRNCVVINKLDEDARYGAPVLVSRVCFGCVLCFKYCFTWLNRDQLSGRCCGLKSCRTGETKNVVIHSVSGFFYQGSPVIRECAVCQSCMKLAIDSCYDFGFFSRYKYVSRLLKGSYLPYGCSFCGSHGCFSFKKNEMSLNTGRPVSYDVCPECVVWFKDLGKGLVDDKMIVDKCFTCESDVSEKKCAKIYRSQWHQGCTEAVLREYSVCKSCIVRIGGRA